MKVAPLGYSQFKRLRIAAGRCVGCGDRKPPRGRRRCIVCANRKRLYLLEYRRKKRRAGLCYCGRKRAKGLTHCNECLDTEMRRYYRKAKS